MEGDIFRTVIPLNDAATLKSGPKVSDQDSDQVSDQDNNSIALEREILKFCRKYSMLVFETSGNSPKKIVTIALQMRGYLACVVGMPIPLRVCSAIVTIFLGELRKSQRPTWNISCELFCHEHFLSINFLFAYNLANGIL